MTQVSVLTAAFASDIGRKRSQNQDSGLVRPDLGLVVVADGMGGHKGGETASKMAVETIAEIIEDAKLRGALTHHDQARLVMTRAIESANERIFQKSSENPELQGMGTTTTALLFVGSSLIIGHVGDSRCYLIRPGKIWQLTRDHSLVQEKLRAGLITRAQVKTDRLKNVITRSVGFEPKVQVDTYEYEYQGEDAFLVCSDGLTGQMDDLTLKSEIENHLFEKNDIAGTVRTLIEKANEAGGDDNVTVALACFMNP